MASPRKHKSGAQKRKEKRLKQVAAGIQQAPAGGGSPEIDPDEFSAAWCDGDDAASAYDEAIAFLRLAMRKSVEVGPQAAMNLERTSRIAASLVKAADPKRQLDEKDAALRKAAEDIAELEARVTGDALQVRPPNHGGSRAAPQH